MSQRKGIFINFHIYEDYTNEPRGIFAMTLEKLPFVAYRLEEERAKDKSKVFPMRLNEQEQKLAKELMILFNVKSPVTAIKFGAEVGRNVLHSTFGADLMKRLFAKERVRLEDYENIEKAENGKL